MQKNLINLISNFLLSFQKIIRTHNYSGKTNPIRVSTALS